MPDNDASEKECLQEIEILKEAHGNENYLSVVILSTQLIVQIIEVLASYSDDWIKHKFTNNLSEDDREVYRLAGQLQKKESDRSYIVGALVGLYDSGTWDESDSKINFIKHFTKLDDLVSLRNTYSHEYYVKKVSKNRAKNCSKAGIELAELFASEFVMLENA